MNYFQRNGSSIYDERRKILENATAWNDEITTQRYELSTDGQLIVFDYPLSSIFVFNDKLYYFFTDFYGQIDSFSELNTSKEDCL